VPFVSGDVVVRQVDNNTWELREELVYQGRTDTFVLPVGFQTDFASVPRQLVWLLPRYGAYTKAAILHDHLWRLVEVGFDPSDADGIFRRAMRELDVPFTRRWMMWAAVRAASFAKSHGESLQTIRFVELVQFLAVAIPSVVFVAVPFLVVTLWIWLFWWVEAAVYLWLRVARVFTRSDRPINKPRLLWRA
jgi:hypothetical protein